MDRGDKDKPSLSVQEAAEWFVRARAALSASERRVQARWFKQAPQNIAEFLRMSQIDGLLRGAKLEKELGDDEPSSNVIELYVDEAPAPVPSRTKAWPWAVAAASGLALAILLAGIAKLAWFDHTIRTAASEWRRQVLTDGSTVQLGPRTRLRVEFSDDRRFVYLSRGEAVFAVAKDAARPFIVDAEMADVRAVGTEFAVTRHDDEVIVTVAEGSVAVARTDRVSGGSTCAAGRAASVTVSAGEQAITSETRPPAVHAVDVERELAWVQGRLIFDKTSIGEAVKELNRLNRLQLDVPDRAIAARQVGGVFNAADPESFAEFLVTVASVTIVRVRPNVLRLEANAVVAPGLEPRPLQAETP